MKTARRIIVFFLAAALLSLSFYCYILTLASGWWFTAISLVAAIITVPACYRFWCRFMSYPKSWQGIGTHLFVAASVVSFLVLGCNYFFAGEPHQSEVTVVRKFSEERTRIRRISRRVYGQGEKYRVYKIEVEFETGFRKDFTVGLERYNKFRKGDVCEVEIAKGLWGVPVVERNSGGDGLIGRRIGQAPRRK